VLRYEARKRRAAYVAGLSTAERQEQEQRLAEILMPLVESANIVAAYHAVGSEIDPQSVLTWAGNNFTTMALPAFADADALMHFRSGVCAEDGPHGIPQPPGQAKIVEPDLVLVPLLAIDAAGTRLGQGGGHYDRVLGALRSDGAKIIGLGWAMQRVDFRIPADPWDVPLDGFASPNGLEMFLP
jgi:5-formyltetrahydrofolate cyclo-ligase